MVRSSHCRRCNAAATPAREPASDTTTFREGDGMAVDQDKLMEFLGKFVGDLGATMAAGNVVVGDRLGLYRALAGRAGRPPQELADATGTDPRYVDGVAARPGGRRLRRVRPPTATVLADRGAGVRARPTRTGRCTCRARSSWRSARCKAEPRITEAFRTGAGVGWHEHDADVFDGLRAVLPARLRRQPDRVVAAGAGRRGGQAARRRPGRRHRLRARRVDGADGHAVPGRRRSSARTTTTARSSRPAAGHRRRRERPGALRGGHARRPSPAGRTTW